MNMTRMYRQMRTVQQEHMPSSAFCGASVLERPRYFPRQLMTPDELILEQDYFLNKLRHHNRLLHGWGVVCGAIVCRIADAQRNGKNSAVQAWPCPEVDDSSSVDPWNVSVSSGYILGPYGDEIMIDCDVVVDVRNACTTVMSGDPCPPAPDPWCNEVTVERRPGAVYLAVRYKEIMTRLVRMQPNGCGCDDAACEYSRIRDGFEICALDAPPSSHKEEPPGELTCELRACPPCPSDPWVVLARIDLDANGIRKVDNYSYRRVLMSSRDLWCYAERPTKDEQREDVHQKMLEENARAAVIEHINVQQDDVMDPARVHMVAARPAVDLRGVRATSPLGNKLETAKLTIAKVAQMERDHFLELVASDAEPTVRNRLRQQAAQVWERAKAVTDAVDRWNMARK